MSDLILIFLGVLVIGASQYWLHTNLANKKTKQKLKDKKLYKVQVKEFKFMALNQDPLRTNEYFVLAENKDTAKGIVKHYLKNIEGFECQLDNLEVNVIQNMLVSC